MHTCTPHMTSTVLVDQVYSTRDRYRAVWSRVLHTWPVLCWLSTCTLHMTDTVLANRRICLELSRHWCIAWPSLLKDCLLPSFIMLTTLLSEHAPLNNLPRPNNLTQPALSFKYFSSCDHLHCAIPCPFSRQKAKWGNRPNKIWLSLYCKGPTPNKCNNRTSILSQCNIKLRNLTPV